MQAIWNNQVIAQSEETIVVEGNHYFPAESVNKEFIKGSELHTTCPYKGLASYYTLSVGGKENEDAAWFYPSTKRGYEKIAGYVAFWRGVKIQNEN